jgi:hypothetical protein
MSEAPHGSPGGHPHADQPNWQPADNIDDYLQNCREGLEEYSDRHAAKLLGVPRIEVFRWKLMAELPEDLFQALLKSKRSPSVKSVAAVAQALKRGNQADTECCPHCGHVLRTRPQVSTEYEKIVNDWLKEKGFLK